MSDRATISSTTRAYVTLHELFTDPDIPEWVELADGELLVMTPAWSDHGYLGRALFRALDAHVRTHQLGEVFGDGFGYELPLPTRPDTFRVPDVSFVRSARIPRPRPRTRAFAIAPDLAVEVKSPSDGPKVLKGKLRDYLEAGTPLVWVVDGDRRTVAVHAPGASASIVPARVLRAGDTLDGGAVLPGFTLPLATLFAVLDE